MAIASLAAISTAHADGRFFDEVRKKVQEIRADGAIEAPNKSDVAIASIFSISLDDAILYLLKQADGSITRIHSNPKYNGKVTKEGDITLYNSLFEAVKGESKEASVPAKNADGEDFIWDVTELDDSRIVVSRHR
ncbi:MAG: hypothetical protein V4544_07175 [Pseudomonadota bacterium]